MGLMLGGLCGCQFGMSPDSSTQTGSYGALHDPYFRSVSLPNKPLAKMNREELAHTAQVINSVNEINRGRRSTYRREWVGEPVIRIWIK